MRPTLDFEETKNKLTQILGRRIRLKGSESERQRQLLDICQRYDLEPVMKGDL